MTSHPALQASARDAPDLLGGVTYQKFVTLLAWLDLGPEEVLHIEKQEDIAVTRDGSGEVVQVRRTRAGLSLNADGARKTIQYAFDREPGLVTVYWTTSPLQQERSLRTSGLFGIELWARAVDGDKSAAETVRGILLKRGGWSEPLSALLRSGNQTALREGLLRRLRWEMDRPSTRLLEAAAKTRLQARITGLRQGRASLARTILPECLAEIDKFAVLPADQRQRDRNDLDGLIEQVIGRIDAFAGLPALSAPAQRGSLTPYALAAHAAQIAGQERLSRAREHLAAGKIHGAITLVDDWMAQDLAEPLAVGAALRFKAEARLALGDGVGAAACASEAAAVDGLDDPLLDCRILGLRDPQAALQQMGEAPELAWPRAEFLLRSGKTGDGLALVRDRPIGEDGAAERRIRAVLTAAAGDLRQALADIESHSDYQADVELRLAAATLHYALAQAKGATTAIGDWPSPTSPGLVQSSLKAQKHLREAATLFDDVGQRLDDAGFKADKAVWRLACLVDLPDGLDDATSIAKVLTEVSPPHPGAIHWALRRNLPIDLAGVEAALGADLDRADAESLVAYGVLLAQREAAEDAARALRSQLPRLEGSDVRFVSDWIDRLERQGPAPEVPAMLSHAVQTGDWSKTAEEAASTERSVEERFTLLQILASEDQWTGVDRSRAFLVDLRTGEALRLAVYAAVHTGDPGQAVTLIDQGSDLFGTAVPDDLQGMRIEALASVGRLPEAFALLDQWSPTATSSRMTEIRLRLNIGDLEGIASRAQALRLADLPVHERLKVANQLALAAPEQARALVKGVDFSATAIDLVPVAFEAAQILQLDRKARKAVERRLFSQEAQEAGLVQKFDLTDVQAFIDNNDGPDPETQYQRGDLALHSLHDRQLGRAFIRLLTGEGPSPDLFTRDAGAQTASVIPPGPIRLDITALLTAHGLNILDAVIETFERVEVSQLMSIALQTIERDLATPQDRLTALEAIVQVCAQHPELVSDADPLTPTLGVQRSGDLSCGTLLKALRGAGHMAAQPAKAASDALHAERKPRGVAPEDGQALQLSAGAAILLAQTDLLTPTLACWRVRLSPAAMNQIQEEAAASRRVAKAGEAVRNLRMRLTADLQSGRITALPVEHTEVANVMLATARDLSRREGPGLAWIEDRAIHLRRPLRERVNVVTAYDVLAHLERHGGLDAIAVREAHRRLRDGGFRFTPLSESEALALLRDAPTEKGVVRGTAELKAISAAQAQDLLSEGALRLALSPDVHTAETDYMAHASRQFDRLLRAVWNSRVSTARRRAWSDWLYQNLRVERLERTPMVAPSQDGQRALFLINLTTRLDISVGAGRTPQDRRDASTWAWDRAIAPELEADPALRADLPAQFATLWGRPFFEPDGRPRRETRAERKDRAALCAAVLRSMPDPMRELVLQSPEVRELVGTALTRRLSLEDFNFEADAVFAGLVKAVRRPGVHRVRSLGEILTIHAEDAGVRVERKDRPDVLLSQETVAVVVAEAGERRQIIDGLLTDLDVDPAEAAQTAERISAISDPYHRIVALSAAQEDTVLGRLSALERQMTGQGVALTALRMPSPVVMKHWLRIETGVSPGYAALTELGPKGFERLVGIPSTLWTNAFAEPAEQLQTVTDAPAWKRSPLGDLFTLGIKARSGLDAEALRAETNQVLDRLGLEAEGFVQLVTQIQRVADRDQAWRVERPELLGLAAWAWADQIWRVCAAHGRRPGSLAEHWARVDGLRPRDMILQARWTGATAMPSISAARLIANGLGFALGDRQSEIPAADIARHLSRLALEAARQGHPMGPLSQAPDAAETWLADVSPYIWTVDGSGVEEAGRSLVADYPGPADNASLAIIGGPDIFDPDTAEALLEKMGDETDRQARKDDLIGELKLLGTVTRALFRRGRLEEGRWDQIIAAQDDIIHCLRGRSDWRALHEPVIQLTLSDAAVGGPARIASRLEALHAEAPASERPLLRHATEVFRTRPA